MNEQDPLHSDALKIYSRHKGILDTSLLTIAELLRGCEKSNSDPEKVVASIFQIASVSGINIEQALRAAHYMNAKHLSAIDALHASLSNFEIISSDKDFNKINIKRIWV